MPRAISSTTSNQVLSEGGQQAALTAGKITGSNTTLNPANMTFSLVQRIQRFYKNLSDIGKAVVSLKPAFDYSVFSDMIWTRLVMGAAISTAWTEDGTYTHNYNQAGGYKYIFPNKPVYPWCHVECTVNPGVSTNGTTNAIGLGLFLTTDGSKWLVAKYDAATFTVTIEYNTGSGASTVPTLSTYTAATYTFGQAPTAPFLFEFTITGRTGTVHINHQHIMSKDIAAAIDMRNPTTGIPLYSWGYYMQSDGTGNAMSVTGDFKLGYFGGTGTTDYRLVTDKWGNPMQTADGYVYVTMDIAGYQCFNGNTNAILGWDCQHCGVFKFHPLTGDLQETAKIFPAFVNNTQNYPTPGYSQSSYTIPLAGGSGSLDGGTDSEMVYDPENDMWTLFSLPGGFPNVTYYSEFKHFNPLHGIITPQMTIFQFVQPSDVTAGGEQLTLNASYFVDNSGKKNVFITRSGDSAGGPRWYQGTSLASLTRIASIETGGYQEGCCKVRVGDRVYVLFTNNNSSGLGHVYDVSNGTSMNLLGNVTYTPAVPTSGIMPWPCLFPYYVDGKTYFYALLFSTNNPAQHYMTLGEALPNGKACWWTSGQPSLYKAAQTINGYQSKPTFYGF